MSTNGEIYEGPLYGSVYPQIWEKEGRVSFDEKLLSLVPIP
jgi:hypothetical protein